MATLFRNSNSPVWRARYFNADGRRISKSTHTLSKAEAKVIAAGYEADSRDERRKHGSLPALFGGIVEAAGREAQAGTLTLERAEILIQRLHEAAHPEFTAVSVQAYWDAWIVTQTPHVGISCISGYKQDKALFAAALGAKAMAGPLSGLTTAIISAALAKIPRRGSTVNKALASLRRVLSAAVDAKLVTANPAKLVRSKTATDSTVKGPFTVEEIRAMIDHADTTDEWRGIITLGAHTGLRLGDLLRLTADHVDGSRLVIRPSKTAKRGKVLTIPLSPPAIAWIGIRRGLFFPTLAGRPKSLSGDFVRIMEAAGVARDIVEAGDVAKRRSFHSLRHTFASWLAEADIHADVRQRLTGHSDAGIHQRYTHHDEALDRAVGTLPSL
jgi:integrase